MKAYHDPTMKMFLEEVRNFKSVTIFEVNNYYQGYRKGFYQVLHERTVKRWDIALSPQKNATST